MSTRRQLEKLLRTARPLVDRLPFVAASYRSLRERMPTFGAPVATSLGFQFVGHAPMLDGTFEPSETKFLEEELGRTDVFVDVGANIGYFTCLARSRDIHTVAIEPLQSNLRVLFRNLKANGWSDKIEIFPLALAETPGLLELYGVSTGASLMAGWAGTSTRNVRIVPVTTLDTLLGERFAGQRLLIKIDVEGAEHQVLRGAVRTLARKPGARWLLEVCLTENQVGINPYFEEVFDAFWANDYRALALDERREITREDVRTWIQTGRRSFGSYSVIFLPRSDA